MPRSSDTIGKPQRRQTRILILWLLVAACVLLDVVVVGEAFGKSIPPEPESIVGLGLALGQMSIVVAWMIWGQWNVMLRIMVTICGTFGIAWLAAVSTHGSREPNIGEWLGALLVYLVILAIPLGIARATTFRIVLGDAEEEAAAGRRRAWQFSIWSLLCAMTAVAVILGVLRYADWLHQGFFNALIFFVIFSTSTTLILLVTFYYGWTAVLIVVAISSIAGGLLQFTDVALRRDGLMLFGVSCMHGMTVFTIANVLQVAGYRLRHETAVTTE